jgi:hypothetical protein
MLLIPGSSSNIIIIIIKSALPLAPTMLVCVPHSPKKSGLYKYHFLLHKRSARFDYYYYIQPKLNY